jgi:glycerol-3-phosphate dehydrogenase subunit C
MIAQSKAEHRKPPVRWLRDWWFARPGLLGDLTTILPALSNYALSIKLARFLMSKLIKITPDRTFPKYTRPNLRSRVNSTNKHPKVAFFPGCFIKYNRPDLGRKIIDVLDRNGFETEVAQTMCCGVPAIANGEAVAARDLARANLKRLVAYSDNGIPILTACSSCGHMLKTGFGGQLEDDGHFSDAAVRVAKNTYDLGEFLMIQAEAGKLNTDFAPLAKRIGYHAPCHQRSQGIGRPWYHLLRQIPSVAVEDLNSGCCGMSGTYGFKQEKYPISMQIGQQLFESVRDSQSELVATECATCQMQIEHGTAVKAIHPVELLLNAYIGEKNL